MKLSYEEIKAMLLSINEDEEFFVPFSDSEYYAEQLFDLELGSEEDCIETAEKLKAELG